MKHATGKENDLFSLLLSSGAAFVSADRRNKVKEILTKLQNEADFGFSVQVREFAGDAELSPEIFFFFSSQKQNKTVVSCTFLCTARLQVCIKEIRQKTRNKSRKRY